MGIFTEVLVIDANTRKILKEYVIAAFCFLSHIHKKC